MLALARFPRLVVGALATAVCVFVSAGRAAAAEAPASDDRLGAAYVDPLGFALFGPTLGAELGFGQLSAVLYGRWFSGGVLSKNMFLDDEGETYGFSYGVGAGGRYYLFEKLAGPHVGVNLELLRTRIEVRRDRVALNTLVLVPQLEGGYRIDFDWLFDRAKNGGRLEGLPIRR